MWQLFGLPSLFKESSENVLDNLIAQQLDYLGDEGFRKVWRDDWERDDSEDDSSPSSGQGSGVEPRTPRRWRLKNRRAKGPLEDRFEKDVQGYRTKTGMALFEQDEKDAILDLIKGMLKFDPTTRFTIEQVLQSEWMVKWALPMLKKKDV
jgi:hypothetical protein